MTTAHSAHRHGLTIKSVRDPASPDDGRRILTDRLWPRGLARSDAPFEKWAKDVAPSAQLRTWYGHVEARFAEFARRYRDELTVPPAREALEELRVQAATADTVLLTATKTLKRSHATVLKDVLSGD